MRRVPQFLLEIYAPPDVPGILPLRAGDIARATEQVSEETAPIRLLGAIFLPEDEICFYLYQASSADAVRAAATRAGLEPDRITPAVSIGWVASAASMPAAQSEPPAAGLGANDPLFPEEI